MVGVDGSSPFAPTKFGREIKHLAETLGAFFLPGMDEVWKTAWNRGALSCTNTLQRGFRKGSISVTRHGGK